MDPKKLSGVDVKIAFPHIFELTGKWVPDDAQRRAAWDLYVELATRVATVEVPPEDGLVREALSSLHALFQATREILRKYGPGIAQPTKGSDLSVALIAVTVLNRGVRPFLSKWHPALAGWEQTRPADKGAVAHEREWPREGDIREELAALQGALRAYGAVLEQALGLDRSLMER